MYIAWLESGWRKLDLASYTLYNYIHEFCFGCHLSVSETLFSWFS